MLSVYETRNVSTTLKRSHFDIESPLPELPSKKKIRHNDIDYGKSNISSNNNNNNLQIFNSILTPAATPATSNNDNTEWLRLRQQQQSQEQTHTNNKNIYNNSTELHTNNDNDIYSEVEDYMVRGYYDTNINNSAATTTTNSSSTQEYYNNNEQNYNDNNTQTFHTQYSLYDLTNEEIDMIGLQQQQQHQFQQQQHCLQDQQMEY